MNIANPLLLFDRSITGGRATMCSVRTLAMHCGIERNNSRRAFVDKTFQYWPKSVPFFSYNFLFKSPEHIRPIYQHWEQRFKFFNPKFLKILPAQSFVRLRKDFCINLAFPSAVFCILCIVLHNLCTMVPLHQPG